MPARIGKLASCTINNWLGDNASTMGAALAFYSAFSLAPLLVVILWLLGWIVDETSARVFLRSQMELLFGQSTTELLLDAMRDSQYTEGTTRRG